MRALKILLALWAALVFLQGGFFVRPASASSGDVNGNGITYEVADLTYLLDYLFENGPPPPNPIDAETDLTAGINLGDALQLIGVILQECVVIPAPYTGVGPYFSEIELTFPVITPGPEMVPFDVTIDLTANPGPDLMGMVITFSYQNQPGHVGVDLNSVDFTGGIVPAEWETEAYVDTLNKKALLLLWAGWNFGPLFSSGTTGVVATLNFTRTENPSGSATFLSPTVFPPSNSPLLIGGQCATPDNRLIPKYVCGKNGDVNCDGKIDIADILYLINYLFISGPSPCAW